MEWWIDVSHLYTLSSQEMQSPSVHSSLEIPSECPENESISSSSSIEVCNNDKQW